MSDKSHTEVTAQGHLVYRFGTSRFRIIGATKQRDPGYTAQETGVLWNMTTRKPEEEKCACRGVRAYQIHPLTGTRSTCMNCGKPIK